MGQIFDRSEASGIAVEQFAVLRHELANVLNGLAGMAKLLKSSSEDSAQEHWLEAIDSSVGQMWFLLESLDFEGASGLQDGNGVFNGLDMLEQLVTAHSPALCEKGLRPLLVLPPELPAYWFGNAGLIRQLLDNLLCNAMKFTPVGDVVVSAWQGEGRSLHLSVSDTGPGVPESDRQRIFHVGERGPVTGDHPGSGLGLSLCRHIAHRLGGEINCHGNCGRGSVFTVVLPGVIRDEDSGGRPNATLDRVYCALDLDPQVGRPIAGFLDRMGVRWGHGGVARLARKPGRLLITVREPERIPGEAWPGIELRPAPGREGDCLRLQPPVLFSTFERAILRQALTWRWQRLSPGGSRD